MKVWVIMGNDYPEAAFSKEDHATAYCKRKTEENTRNMEQRNSGKIYYRAYPFTLDNTYEG